MKAAIAFLVLVLLARPADACSRASLTPTLPPANVVAFEGVVVGYTNASEAILGFTKILGLSVRVETPLLWSDAGSTVVVYLFGSAPDCSPDPRELAELESQYPVGARVTVIGRPADGQPLSRPPMTLISHADSWGHVAAVPLGVPLTPEGVLDFSAFAQLHEEQPEHGFSLPLAWREAHRDWYENYQYLRCLLLLAQPSSEARTVAILRNLRSYSPFGGLRSSWNRENYRTIVLNSRLSPSLKKRVLAAALHQ